MIAFQAIVVTFKQTSHMGDSGSTTNIGQCTAVAANLHHPCFVHAFAAIIITNIITMFAYAVVTAAAASRPQICVHTIVTSAMYKHSYAAYKQPPCALP